MRQILPEPVRGAVVAIFNHVEALRQAFPEKRFTPGDRLIGDIGEVLAETLYDVEALASNSKIHDCKCAQTNRHVQVKATSGGRVGLGLEKQTFNRLLVFKIYPEGEFEVIYNGDGDRVAAKIAGNSSPSIQVSALRDLDAQVPDSERVKPKRPCKAS